MKAKFIDTLFDLIVEWYTPRKKKSNQNPSSTSNNNIQNNGIQFNPSNNKKNLEFNGNLIDNDGNNTQEKMNKKLMRFYSSKKQPQSQSVISISMNGYYKQNSNPQHRNLSQNNMQRKSSTQKQQQQNLMQQIRQYPNLDKDIENINNQNSTNTFQDQIQNQQQNSQQFINSQIFIEQNNEKYIPQLYEQKTQTLNKQPLFNISQNKSQSNGINNCQCMINNCQTCSQLHQKISKLEQELNLSKMQLYNIESEKQQQQNVQNQFQNNKLDTSYEQKVAEIKKFVRQFPVVFYQFKQLADQWLALDIHKQNQNIENLIQQTEKLNLDSQNKSQSQIQKEIQVQNKIQKDYEDIVEETNILKFGHEQRNFFPKIKLEQFEKVVNVFKSNLDHQIIVKHQHIKDDISYYNLKTLIPTNWLNDAVINAYIQLMLSQANQKFKEKQRQEEIFIFNTYFFDFFYSNNRSLEIDLQKINWSKILKIIKSRNKNNNFNTQKDIVYVPINQNKNHWVFVEINCPEKTITYYDSFNKQFSQVQKYLTPFQLLINKMQEDQQMEQQKFDLKVGQHSQQQNGCDCGMFMLKGIHYLLMQKNNKITFDQSDIKFFRYLVCHELIQGKIETQNNKI